MTTVTATPADAPEASHGPVVNSSSVEPCSSDMARLAAAYHAADVATVTVATAGGPRVQAAYGFDPADPRPVAALYERVVRDRCPEIIPVVTDNDCGIPEYPKIAIFEPFFTTKGIGKGAGQGLALTRAVLVDGCAGTNKAHSAPDEGTEFVLRLPIHGKAAEQA